MCYLGCNQDKRVGGKDLLKVYPEYLKECSIGILPNQWIQFKLLINTSLINAHQKVYLKQENYFTTKRKSRLWVICYPEATIGCWNW